MLPPLTLRYLKEFTDDTGLLQHAKYLMPDRREGYSTDDNARALVVVSRYYDLKRSKEALRLAKIYLSFLYYMHMEGGMFYNKLSYDRQHKWDTSEDCYGRAIWGCASLYASKMPEKLRLAAKELLDISLGSARSLKSPRSIAITVLGLYDYYSKVKEENILKLIEELAWRLVELYNNTASESWKWFEDIMAYENARLPQALFLAYDIVREKTFLDVAKESFRFLSKVTIINGIFWPIGNRGWYKRGGMRALYDQQPVEAGAMVETAITAFRITRRRDYLRIAKVALEWYLGRNSARVRIYDNENGGCYDGITPWGLNYNQGAESALSFLLARLEIERAKIKLHIPKIMLKAT